jgi:hypothetical protein
MAEKEQNAMEMELDALKEMWAEHDRKLDLSIRLNRQVLSGTKLNRARSAMQRLAASLGVEAAIQLGVVVLLGSFIGDHIRTPRFALTGAVLDVFAIAILIALIQQIVLALRIDYDQSIIAIQRQLAALRLLRVRYTLWILVAAPLIWTPLFIVAMKAFWGLDAFHIFGAAFLAANLLFGLAVILLAIGASRKFGGRMGRSPVLQVIMRTLAGYNLNAATSYLAALSDFEKETR